MKRSTARQFYQQYFSATKDRPGWPAVCRATAENVGRIDAVGRYETDLFSLTRLDHV
jgi:hypothetical protein